MEFICLLLTIIKSTCTFGCFSNKTFSTMLYQYQSCFWLKYFKCIPYLSSNSITLRWMVKSVCNILCSSICFWMVWTHDTDDALANCFSTDVNHSTNACNASWNSLAYLYAITNLIFLSFARAKIACFLHLFLFFILLYESFPTGLLASITASTSLN